MTDSPSELQWHTGHAALLASAPWPTFRHDGQNSGRSDIPAFYHGDLPWSFQTGKGIFSTAVVDGPGTLYIGSADHNLYAINPDGTEKWRFTTGEVIDSAGALLTLGPPVGAAALVFPSGDGYLYCLQTDNGNLLWAFDARVTPRSSYNNWFEGNVAVHRDGTLYAGNTNFNYYAINPTGSLKWSYETGANNWSCAAFGADGTIYWASLDTKVRAVRPDGTEKWSRRTLGFVAASAAVGSDGTIYIGSFDSHFYALDPDTGRTRWKFKTGDHIYCSAALGADASGQTDAIYFGSTDGRFYALTTDGKELWRYDTGLPIRSSPVLGRAPKDESGDIVYFGCGNGRLYALNTVNGHRRWSFDTTSEQPELRDRNDLNGSPALGLSGIYIGGEHGQVWYVPYDYPLHVNDRRCKTDPGEDLPANVAGVVYVTPGGNTGSTEIPTLPVSTIITVRLVVRQNGETVDARVYNSPLPRLGAALQITADPPFAFDVEQSADGTYLHIVPETFLEPGATYTLRIDGDYYTDGLSIGNLTLGGRKNGRFGTTVSFRTEKAQATDSLAAPVPLQVSADVVSAFEWTRLSVPIPTMLPSLNQIGFDYMDWVVGTVSISEPRDDGLCPLLLWAIGGRRDQKGVLVADPDSDFMLPLSGTCRGSAFIVTNRRFTMAVTGIPIPFNLFQLRGTWDADLRVGPGATVYADTQVLSVPTFGPYLVLGGLANNWWQKLLAVGTYVTRPYGGPANRRPAGLSVASVDYSAPTRTKSGLVLATLQLDSGAAYPGAEHRPGILLLDASNGQPVSLDYARQVASTCDELGNVSAIRLTIPAKTRMPKTLHAIVLSDVFPLHNERLA